MFYNNTEKKRNISDAVILLHAPKDPLIKRALDRLTNNDLLLLNGYLLKLEPVRVHV